MIHINNLTKHYGSVQALDRVSFGARGGEVLGLLGLNGAGKTTCLRILTGYLMPSAGSCSIDNVDVFTRSMEVRNRIGYLPEVPPLYPELTVGNYLLFVARMRGVKEEEFQSQLEQVVGVTNLGEVLSDSIHKLSLGFRKRVGLAQALIGSPSVLILDEPISGLDPVQIIEMRKLIRKLAGRYTILISSHILTEVSQTCDKVVILHKGKVAGELEGANLKGDLESHFIKLTGVSN